MTPHPIVGLSAIADRYDVALCDVWGVIHNGREAYRGPCAALSRWRRERGPVILISNSPRPGSGVADQLDALGVPRPAWSELVTSGDVTRDLLAGRAPGPAWRIGPERDAPLYDGLGLAFAGAEEAAFIVCTGPTDDEVETPEDYREPLARGVARDLEMICANPDRVVQRGDRLIYCAGALADLYQSLGGRVVMAGKPHRPIYDRGLARAANLLGGLVDPARVLVIGDGIATDLAGAQRQGLDALFVASGIHGAVTLGRDGGLEMPVVEALLAAEGVSAAFVIAELSW
jgi:HAD superfamily hydrolase (TIGR01459 family)